MDGNPTATKTNDPNSVDLIGDINVAVMGSGLEGSKIPNITGLVSTALEMISLGLDLSESVVSIVKSFVILFIARRSLRKGGFFSTINSDCKPVKSSKEFHRFVNSMRYTAKTIKAYENEVNQEQSFCKYYLDFYLGKVFKDISKPIGKPSWIKHQLFSGWCLNMIKRSLAKRDGSFIYSLQKGTKKAWPQLSASSLQLAYEKHRRNLTGFKGAISPEFEKCVLETASQVFRTASRTPRTKFVPSFKSCIQASCSDGGKRSLIPPFDFNEAWSYEAFVTSGPDTLPIFNIGKYSRLQNFVRKLYDWRSSAYKRAVELSVLNFQPIYDDIRPIPGFDPSVNVSYRDFNFFVPALDISLVAIPEASKFRIISKMCGATSLALSPLQGIMLDCWKADHASTMMHDDLTAKMEELITGYHSILPILYSIDYSDATDLLKKSATLAAYSALKGCPDYELGLASLSQNRVFYPGRHEPDLLVEGQLMGHDLSFALLCVINKAVHRFAIKLWYKSTSTPSPRREEIRDSMKKAVLVNGDDMIVMGPEDFYPYLEIATKDAGFKLSPGKNYQSRDMVMMNSQLFRVSNNKVKRLGYLNQKLLYDKPASDREGNVYATPVSITQSINKMVNLCPWTNCTVPMIYNRWKKDWKGRFTPNWYASPHLGGYGLNLAHGPPIWQMSKSQLIYAAQCVFDPLKTLYRNKGLNPRSLEFAKYVLQYNWVDIIDILPDHLSLDLRDPWLELGAYAALVSTPEKENIVNTHKSFVDIKNTRFKPMSKSKFLKYTYAMKLAAIPRMECPKLNNLRSYFEPYKEMPILETLTEMVELHQEGLFKNMNEGDEMYYPWS
jgi:hypothetical protein